MKRTNIHLSEVQLKRLGQLSKKTGLPVAEFVRRAVDLMLRLEAVSDGKRK